MTLSNSLRLFAGKINSNFITSWWHFTEVITKMTATIRFKAIGRVLDKRTINKFLKHSQTLFLFTVILSSVLFFSTSKMLKKSRKHTQLHVRVLDNDKEYPKEKSSLLINEDSSHLIEIVQLPGHQSADRVQINDVKVQNNIASLNGKMKRPDAIELCKKSSIDLLILIFSEEPMTSEREFIRSTWCKRHMFPGNRRMTCLFMIGQSSTKQVFSQGLLQEAMLQNDVILMSLHDDIRNSTLKLTTSMKWVSTNCPDVRYVLRTEDDVIINIDKLMNDILRLLPETNFAGGKCTVQKPVRNPHSKYYVSHKEYPHEQFPPVCSNMGYILSYDVFTRLHKSSINQNLISLDNIQVAILLRKLTITTQNIPSLVHGKAFQIHGDPSRILCDYVIVHLHGHTEEETVEVWDTMLKCKKI